MSLSSSYEAAKDAYNKAIAAAKTATDYMDFGADGLVVGDMASGALAGNVSIKSDGVELRYESSVLARLKAGVLELAANSVNAVVKLCGGKGTIAYYAATNELAIMSPGQTVLTTCMTLPDGTVQSSDVGVACRRDSVLIKGAVEMHGGLTVDYAPVYGGKILFYNPSQSMAGTIELSETAEGYNYFDLLCKTDQSHYFSVKVPDPNNKMAVLSANVFDGNNAAVVKSKVVHITGKIINTATWWPGKYATGQSYIWANSTCGSDYGDFVTVVCVVGYK
ncbi:hypothetical protein [Gordonibacter sp.]|uniref:hypothetical protein n=1 Tax=Gordonibacter sp. TaxID=1968902 RepID=UPI002FC85B2D